MHDYHDICIDPNSDVEYDFDNTEEEREMFFSANLDYQVKCAVKKLNSLNLSKNDEVSVGIRIYDMVLDFSEKLYDFVTEMTKIQ